MYNYVLPPRYYVPAHQMAKERPELSARNNFPPVDPTQFTESAAAFQSLMHDANKIIDKFSSSKEFATKVMDYAQKSNEVEVKKMIQTIGIKNDVEIKFNPDSINFTFLAKTKDIDCCKLVMALHW